MSVTEINIICRSLKIDNIFTNQAASRLLPTASAVYPGGARFESRPRTDYTGWGVSRGFAQSLEGTIGAVL